MELVLSGDHRQQPIPSWDDDNAFDRVDGVNVFRKNFVGLVARRERPDPVCEEIPEKDLGQS